MNINHDTPLQILQRIINEIATELNIHVEFKKWEEDTTKIIKINSKEARIAQKREIEIPEEWIIYYNHPSTKDKILSKFLHVMGKHELKRLNGAGIYAFEMELKRHPEFKNCKFEKWEENGGTATLTISDNNGPEQRIPIPIRFHDVLDQFYLTGDISTKWKKF